ncbi:MAG: thiamine phosphate synthase [Phascolarctobacterium sp.]|nr:thiamine phosphate synthase [Phascolarctobacterium sp.]MBQ7760127.1 thiamine phosphate synthase [Acidaminococcaceae bacterium]
MKAKIDYSIYLVTDEVALKGRELLPVVEEALQGGVTLLQYRNKNGEGGKLYAEALALKELCDKYNVPLIIDDRLDIAIAVGAAGVHIGQDDIPCKIARQVLGDDFIIGVSAHNPAEAQQAIDDGADYLGCGAVYATTTKAKVTALGLDGLAAIRRAVQVPMVGIGGVDLTNAKDVLATGVEGIAIVRAILGAQDVTATTQEFVKIKKNM